MRSITSRFDPSRRRGDADVRSKYIFAFEGNCTEVAYFRGVSDNRGIAGISSLVGICVLQREEIDSGCSDPVTMLNLLKENIRAMETGTQNVQTVCESVKAEIARLTGMGRSDHTIKKVDGELPGLLDNCCDGDIIIDMEKTKDVCDRFIKSLTGRQSDIYIPDPESYDPKVDHVCVIIDRDRSAHPPQVMDGFITECRRNGFEPYICNPCFEFWLMLHFDEVLGIDRDVLLQNEMIDGKRFTEVKLDEIVSGINPDNHYDKNDLDPLIFMHRIGNAVRNNKHYCSDPVRLKHEVGTNLGGLFERMM